MITTPDPGGDVVPSTGIRPTPGASAALVPGVSAGLLAAAAGLHVVWAASPWPFATRAEYAEAVVGVPEAQAPGPALTLLVATALLGSSVGVLAGAGRVHIPVPDRWVRVGLWLLAAVLLLRGAGGLLASAFVPGSAPWAFRRLDLLIYSPLCLLLATGVASTLRRNR